MMKYLDVPFGATVKSAQERALNLSSKFTHLMSIHEALSEGEILMLQEQFLTSGFHYLQVRDSRSGRALMNAFLSSLDYHHNVGCITVDSQSLSGVATDIYQELLTFTQGNKPTIPAIEEFLVDQGYYDFIWIEASTMLLAQPWFHQFEEVLLQLQIDVMIPIVVVGYTH